MTANSTENKTTAWLYPNTLARENSRAAWPSYSCPRPRPRLRRWRRCPKWMITALILWLTAVLLTPPVLLVRRNSTTGISSSPATTTPLTRITPIAARRNSLRQSSPSSSAAERAPASEGSKILRYQWCSRNSWNLKTPSVWSTKSAVLKGLASNLKHIPNLNPPIISICNCVFLPSRNQTTPPPRKICPRPTWWAATIDMSSLTRPPIKNFR